VTVDLSPLLRGARGETIRVAGVCVGDPAENVDRASLTGAEDRGDGPRIYKDGSVYRQGPGGDHVEIPLVERVDATIRIGGVLRMGGVALSVAGGVIDRIFVRGPSLETLRIATEDDIERVFGPAEGKHWLLGQRHHYYPARGFDVAWDARTERVEHVALGARPWTEPRIGAPELVEELLALGVAAARGPEPKGGPERARHQRVAALARALGVGSAADVADGVFLDEPLSTGRRAVLEELLQRSRFARPYRDSSARTVFAMLLGYREGVRRVVQATSGWLECSDGALLGMIVTQNQIGGRIEELMVDVDRWLRTLIDPDGRTFEVRELIATYGWPDVDLWQLEADEL
jgi:hypothetical protein